MKERNTRMIETNGIKLKVIVEGSGPLLLLLHGFPQSGYLWRNQIDDLVAAGYQVAVPINEAMAAATNRQILRRTTRSRWLQMPSASPTHWDMRRSRWSLTTGARSSAGTWPRCIRNGSTRCSG